MKKQIPIDLESLLKEIYLNSTERKIKVNSLLDTLQPLIKDITSAVNLLPDIVKLQQVAINNDDSLVKLATIIVKSTSKKSNSEDDDMFALTDSDYKQLMSKAKQNIDTEVPGVAK